MLEELIKFFKYQNLLKNVRRNNWTTDGRKESSAEHSWSVAMMVWFLKEYVEKDLKINLDENRLIKMALIHDLVEIEAGDVEAWNDDKRSLIAAQEEKAIETIDNTYFDKLTPNIKELWIEHEELKSYEAKLVKACDQLCPLIYRVVYNCSYNNTGVNRQKLDEIFIKIVSFSEVTLKMYHKLADEIEEKGLFDQV